MKQEPKNASAPRRLRFIRTPHYNGQFALSLGKETHFLLAWNRLIFSKSTRFIFTDTFYGPLCVRINGVRWRRSKGK